MILWAKLKKGGIMKTKTVTLYECEYCGLSSENKKHIEECEKGHKDVIAWADKQSYWGRNFIMDVGRHAYKTALALLAKSENHVEIQETDELGPVEYAIVPTEDTEFWLETFTNRKDAEKLCKEMGWKYD